MNENVVAMAERSNRRETQLLELYAEAPLPTHRGVFRTVVFREKRSAVEHVRNANFESRFVPLNDAVGVGELPEFNANGGGRCSRL